MMRSGRSFVAVASFVALTGAGVTGCSSLNNTERGAVIGAGAGGAIGAVIGRQTGSTAAGAIIGAAVGGAAGAVIGRKMDQEARELETQLPEGATVSRVGEGILVTFESGLLFPYDSADLLPAGRQNLASLATTLRGDPEADYELLVVGHTDSRGADTYNQGLSERRAQSAADILVANGIPRDRIRTTGRGESEPVASNDTEAGMQLNRRVEVAIFASEEYRERVLRSNPGQ